jgi:Domain of unknown function (DUF4845)
MNGNRKSQRGVTLSGLLTAGVAAKLAPDLTEYFQIMQSIKEVAHDPAMKTASVADIRHAYGQRAIVERIQNVQPDDLDITKDGNDIVLSFAYERKIPLFTNVSLLIDFQGSSSSAK